MICPITDLASFSQEGRRQDHSSEEGFWGRSQDQGSS
jgi:hypothetical protein